MKSWLGSFGRARALACASALVVVAAAACSSAPASGTDPSAEDGGLDAGSPVQVTGDDAPSALEDTAAPPVTGDDDGSDANSQGDANPSSGGLAPAPVLTTIAPTQAIVGTTGPTIVCSGTGFVARSVVQVNAVPLATSFVSGTELRATIPTSNMGQVGTLHVTVGTGPPGGGGSTELEFQVVNPAPAITSLAPTSVLLGAGATPITVTGSLFVTGASISFAGAPLPTVVVDTKTVTATIPAASIVSAGTFPVTVTNPTPGGGTSSSIAFIVANPTVTITAVTPSALTVGSPSTVIALAGTGFVPASAVSFNGTAIPTTYTSSAHLAATVPASSLVNAGSFPVVVTNPAPGGGVSTPATVHLVYPPATATALSPSSIVLGAPPPTLTVTGTGFLPGVTTIAFGGAAALTTVADGSHASATLTTQQVATARTFQVTVANPAPGGGTSAPLAFSVNDPAPTVASLSPSATLLGSPDTTVTVSGAGFVPASSVLASGAPLATTYVNATTLAAAIPAARLAVAGALSISVSTPAPGGGTSGAVTFSVNDPAPVATAVSPSFALVGAPDTAVNITGSGFLPSSSALLGGAAVGTTYVSSTSLQAVLPAASLAGPGTLSLSVSNPAPGGGTSGTLGFTVDNPGPTITLLTPSSVLVPAPDTLVTVTGTGFVTGVTVVQIGGTPVATSYAGAALGAVIPAAQLASAGTLSITAVNPSPGGGTSNVAFFAANDPVPAITSVAPASIYVGAAATAVTLTGTGFIAASTVTVNGASVAITGQTATTLTVTVPASLLAAPGTLSLSVQNPVPGGGTSGVATIAVVCDVTGADVVLTSLSTPGVVSLSFTGAPTAYRITTSRVNDACPSSDDNTALEPYRGYVVVNDTAQAATLSAWAACTKTDDGFLTFYQGGTVPTTQAQLEACAGYIAEGASGAGGLASPEPGTSSYCPGLTKANGTGLAIPACGLAVVLVQPYSATSPSYTPPTTLKVELQ